MVNDEEEASLPVPNKQLDPGLYLVGTPIGESLARRSQQPLQPPSKRSLSMVLGSSAQGRPEGHCGRLLSTRMTQDEKMCAFSTANFEPS